ncbi:hypothetical protein [Geodermatophilus sp. FMUSA9-8]|uniref:hypothetical protein n=1 Tax=Geodermatophilus sp. FMUSA9-8 TaxID=3120155 RepID=UPI003007FE92
MVAQDTAKPSAGDRSRALVVGAPLGGAGALQVAPGSLRTAIGVPVLVARHSGASSWWLDEVLVRTSRPDRFAAACRATHGVLPSHTLRT